MRENGGYKNRDRGTQTEALTLFLQSTATPVSNKHFTTAIDPSKQALQSFATPTSSLAFMISFNLLVVLSHSISFLSLSYVNTDECIPQEYKQIIYYISHI
eukprot:GHVR01184609.1.p1 GENE.GHVR01184609.1~~GHVR01184609.1.p1  ORF type:complete len:101 (+),score=7.48 GHVR01184609.1:424-726(+)